MENKVDHKIRILDQNGRFSKPEETLDAFLQQARPTSHSKDSVVPYSVVRAFSEQLHVDVQSMPVETSSQGLLPWEVGCCWIDNEGNPLIRMRPAGRRASLISQNTLLVHELVHAVRGRLSSAKFEEFCAYDICSFLTPLSKWRRFLGPLFSSAKEFLLLLLLLWCGVFLPLFFDLLISPAWFYLVPTALFTIPFSRLFFRWRTWNKALDNIERYWPGKARALLIRLSDNEIVWLAKLGRNSVVPAVYGKSRDDWRWNFFFVEILESPNC